MIQKLKLPLFIALTLALAGCPTPAVEVDSGAARDSGASRDSGAAQDSGTSRDSGTVADASAPTDGAVGDGGAVIPVDPLEVIVGEGPAPTVDEVLPIPVTLERGFVCLDAGVGTEMSIADVEGSVPGADGIGDQVVIISRGECVYDLVYRSTTGDLPLSTSTGGYILASATLFTDLGTTLVCASDVDHIAGTAEPNERLVQSVSIRCWARDGAGAFIALPDAVVPEGAGSGADSTYAAWIDSVSAGTDGGLIVHWMRDFSFQFLNMSDSGRPDTDGAYTTALSFDGSTLSGGAIVQESASVLGAPPETGEWIPSAEERLMADGLFDITDGECAEGCLP